MSKKKRMSLLNEETVRRFMGLAKIPSITADKFLSEYADEYADEMMPEDEEDLDLEIEPGPEDDEGFDGGAPEAELDPDTQDVINQLATNIAQKISQAFEETPGVSAELSVAAANDDFEEPGEGEDLPPELPPEDGAEADLDLDAEEAPLADDDDSIREAIVNEILRRVAKRLITNKK